MSNILRSVAPQRASSLLPLAFQQKTQSAHEAPKRGGEASLTCKQNQKASSGLLKDIWLIILKNCWQDGARNLYSVSLVCKTFYRWADEVKNVKDWQIHQFLFSVQAQELCTEKTLEELQRTFQTMREAVQKGEVLQVALHKKAFQKAVKEATLKQGNLPLTRLIQSFLLKEIKGGNFPAAIKVVSTRYLREYKEGDSERYKIKPPLTQGDLVAMELCTLKELKEEISLGGRVTKELSDETILAKKVTDELGLFILTHIDSILSQVQKPNIKRVPGLFPEPVWNGVIKTYEKYGLREVEDLLASRVEAIVGTETAHWAISKGKRDLFIALLKNDFNPDALNAAGKSLLYWAMEHRRLRMVDDLLKYGADVSHLLKIDSSINPIHWAISRNRGYFLEKLLALVTDQNVLNDALAYAEKVADVNASTVKILLERKANSETGTRHQGQQTLPLPLSKSA